MITKSIQKHVLEWLTNDPSCTSSETMAFWLAFGIKKDDATHPECAVDLNSCLSLLKKVPELRPYLHRMGKLSTSWKNLVSEWESVESMFLEEAGLNWSRERLAPKTCKLMTRVIGA